MLETVFHEYSLSDGSVLPLTKWQGPEKSRSVYTYVPK